MTRAWFSARLMTLLQLLHIVAVRRSRKRLPDFSGVVAGVAGAVAFPLFKAIIESFDGSQSFFRRH